MKCRKGVIKLMIIDFALSVYMHTSLLGLTFLYTYIISVYNTVKLVYIYIENVTLFTRM